MTAARLATVEGLDGLSITRLAEASGMSKGGLYAHFGSKEALQLATIDTAREIFDDEVVAKALAAPAGRDRLLALTNAFLDHLERRVFPGGCFFATVAAQLAARPGRTRDRVMDMQRLWLELVAEAVRQAVAAGELPADADVDQLAFEITAMLVRANFAWIVAGDPGILDRARVGIGHVLERAARPAGRNGGRPRRPRTKAGG